MSSEGYEPGAGLHEQKFSIDPSDAIATAGSCFAQHIARNLRANGFNVVDSEPAPPFLSASTAEKFGFGVYSARFGNIYYVRQLLQLAQEAFGLRRPANWIWTKDGRYYDALRPTVEPNGLSSPESVKEHREQHLRAVRTMVKSATVLVFTFGLTEGWVEKTTGTVFPTAPGTVCGDFDSEIFEFKNFDYPEILSDFQELRNLLLGQNPDLKFIITVSPVALAATATKDHVLLATTYSKSVLRAVTGELSRLYTDVDYFPSFEIITGSQARGTYWDESLRGVSSEGVNEVMRHFFYSYPPVSKHGAEQAVPSSEELLCEEAMLEVFAE
ncbi:GSCFA domain-containing protein [Pseudarthrobacter sp. IC2-21]|uniref:GSCFA domain-containing protein n=1 Tax=Pseudarthrobacter sp. IC2-21 TaxID=3092262 RepID=UPI002A6B01F1|nr:GSCFA domain-containing protein [Pseudarthrobacter sp. IC2-21]